MKTIKKLTNNGDTQIFEIITNRKELSEFLHGELHEYIYSEYANDWHPDKVFEDGDTTICYYDKNNKFTWIAEGEIVKRPNIANIKKLISTNAASTIIFGDVSIVFNDHYGDWEVNFN